MALSLAKKPNIGLALGGKANPAYVEAIKKGAKPYVDPGDIITVNKPTGFSANPTGAKNALIEQTVSNFASGWEKATEGDGMDWGALATTVIETGADVYNTKQQLAAQKKALKAASHKPEPPAPMETVAEANSGGFNKTWLIAGGIGLAALAAIFLFRKR